jgi:uncharacterized DUF497 family protein
MRIVWDEPKRLINIARHAMDFSDLAPAFFDSAIVRQSHSGRWLAIGGSSYGMIAVVFKRLGTEAVSVISMRPASSWERRLANGQ